jgi:hypothetical protein
MSGELFFTLEYDPPRAAFIRKRGGAEEVVTGKEALALLRGYNPLLKTDISLADRESRLMELGIAGGLPNPSAARAGSRREKRFPEAKKQAVPEIRVILRLANARQEEWFPIGGLPNHRLWRNRVYEIIPPETMGRLFPRFSLETYNPVKMPVPSFVLRDEEIPAFADNNARLIYVFADRLLYGALSQENLFVRQEDVSLVLRCAPAVSRGVGTPRAEPALKYGKKLFSAKALSLDFRRTYLPLEGKWVRRGALEAVGIGPLGRYINGEPLAAFGVKPRELLLRGGESLTGIWSGFEPAAGGKGVWVRHGGEQEIFAAHLDFLRTWGLPGGMVSGDREKTASALAAWLTGLAKELDGEARAGETDSLFNELPAARVLVLVPKTFWDRLLVRELPQGGEGPLTVPPGRYAGAASVWAPGFRGIGIAFYSDLPAGPRQARPEAAWDILVLAGADEALVSEETGLRVELLDTLKAVSARQTLGVFFNPAHIFDRQGSSPHAKLIKSFFGVRGNLAEYEKHLFRETGDFLSLPPAFEYRAPRFLRPPDPWAASGESAEAISAGSGRFTVEAKFRNIKTPEFREEQERFFEEGNGAAGGDIPPALSAGYAPGFSDLGEDEKNYFFTWRGAFRKGASRRTGSGCVVLYCRELVLLMGGLTPAAAFAELTRLYGAYGKSFPELRECFPQWLLDFAVIHNCSGLLKPRPAPAAASVPQSEILADLYLHQKYIEENNVLEFADFVPLLPARLVSGPFRLSSEGNRLDGAVSEALNNIDRRLRRDYGKKLLEFFYPVLPRETGVTAFDGLGEIGHSGYTARWVSFSGHKAFTSFLSSLTGWLEYRLRRDTNFDHSGSPPPLDPLWKFFAGLSGPKDEMPEELERRPVELAPERISRLREESEAVMEMLKTESTEDGNAAASFEPPPANPVEAGAFLSRNGPKAAGSERRGLYREFAASLDGAEYEVLEMAAAGKTAGEIERFAGEQGTMADLVFDSINEKFLEICGDLLIDAGGNAGDSLDKKPVIQAEYRDEVLWALTFRNGSAPQ